MKGFGRRPLTGRSCGLWGRRPKASQGEVGGWLGGRDLWEFLGSRTKRWWDWARWRGEFAAGVKAASFFAEDPARVGREVGAWRGTGGRVRPSPSCSGAREAGRNGVARRKAGRRRS